MNPHIKTYLKKTDGVLISSWANITYLTSYSNFSPTERECFLLITQNRKYLITDKRYSEAVAKLVSGFEVIDEGAARFIDKNHSNILKNLRIRKLGIEENNLTIWEYRRIKRVIKRTVNTNLSNLRIVKQGSEIKNIKLACAISDKAFLFIIKQLKLGVSEQEIADKLETFINSKGADFSFKPIVAFGKNSSVPHHLTGQTKLKSNQIVLLDFGVKVNNYCSDMSRTVFFGKADENFKKMHRTVLAAQQKAIDKIKPGIKASVIDRAARKYIIDQGYPNMFHSLGHGVGIEVHEAPHLSPNSKDVIQNGMVFSVEPGIYIPRLGGVRIENLVLVRSGKAELISGANREIIEL